MKLLGSILLLSSVALVAHGYTCPAGKSKKVIKLGMDQSEDLETQEGDKYGKNVNCKVIFKKKNKKLKCNLEFSCDDFALIAKKPTCKGGSDFFVINRKKYCGENSPEVETTKMNLAVLFKSNKRSKGDAGAICTATCVSEAATTAAPTTAAPTTAAPTTAAPTTAGTTTTTTTSSTSTTTTTTTTTTSTTTTTTTTTTTATTEFTGTPAYRIQPHEGGCYTSDCPAGCQLVLLPKLMDPVGGLYVGVPASASHTAVTPGTRLYRNTAGGEAGAWGAWTSTYYLFHHRELNMWVVGESEEALTSLGSEKIKAQSGQSGPMVVPAKNAQEWTYWNNADQLTWTWNEITPLCMDDNQCVRYLPSETSRSLMHQSYPFSERRDGAVVTQFTYKGERFIYNERTDSEGALLYSTRGVPLDLPIDGLTDLERSNAVPRRFRVLKFSESKGFKDILDFDPMQAVTERLNDDRLVQAAAIHASLRIPESSGLTWTSGAASTGTALSWELWMDIRVTHSTNATYFKTVGWGPGGYSGIQQTPDTRTVPSGKNFIFSMWNTNTDNWGEVTEGVPNYVYVDEVNNEANVGGKTGVMQDSFGGEGTGQKMMIDYPWSIGDTTTVVVRGSRKSLDSMDWCITSGLKPPGQEEVFLARFCRDSPEDPLMRWGFGVFVEDWLAPSCEWRTNPAMNFKVQRAAVFSNWKVVVDGKEVDGVVPNFIVNNYGYARGLTDAGMLGDKAFYISTGGWKYDTFTANT